MDKTEHFSRDEIDLESLRKLQDLFGKDGELDQASFVEAFGSILGNNLTNLQLTHLFMKIDANSDGSVDWDEFTNYMFLDNQDTAETDTTEQQEEDDEVSAQFFPASYDIFELNNGKKHFHKDQVTSLLYLEKNQQLLSASRDGMIRFWHPTTLVHQSSFHTGALSEQQSTSGTGSYERNWITDVIFMTQSNKLAVASIDTGVSIYDMLTESKKKVGSIPLEKFRHAAPLCLGYHHDSLHQKELLLIGDDCGAAYVYTLEEKNWTLVEKTNMESIQQRVQAEEESDELVALREQKSGVKRQVLRKHTDHVTQIEYISDLSSLVTCSLDSTVNVYDLERGRLKRTFTQHKKAVYSFQWCPSAKVIASCGLERHIVLWSPYSRRSVASLHGHTSSVLEVKLNDNTNQLISLSCDNTVKVWDVRNHKCVQTISFAEQEVHRKLTPVPVTCLTYINKHKSLVAASNKLKIFPLKQNVAVSTKSHNRSVVSALYNANFRQVISVDEKANLNIWNIETGAIISRFVLRPKNAEVDEIDQNSSKLAAAAAENAAVAATAAGLTQSWDENGQAGAVDAVKAASEIALSLSDGGDTAFGTGEQSVTAMCFDDGGRRLITGSHAGSDLKVWNFSNGCCLKSLLKRPDCPDEWDYDKDELKKTRWRGRLNHKSKRQACNFNDNSNMNDFDPHQDEDDRENEAENSAEVTRISYAVNVLPRIPGQPSIKNKFIVSVGWDRKIYVWSDGGKDAGANEQGYSIRMPVDDDDLDQGHTDDIITIAFIPPNVIATGGYDGRVVFWCLSSGQMVRRFDNLGSAGIESSVFINRFQKLLFSRNDGSLLCMDTVTSHYEVYKDDVERTILSLTTDESNDLLLSGDEHGYVKVWDIIDTAQHPDVGGPIVAISHWKAHDSGGITCLDFIQENGLAETFVISGCSGGLVKLWTVIGVPVGQFGQTELWNLNTFAAFSQSSYRELCTRSVDILNEMDHIVFNKGTELVTLSGDENVPLLPNLDVKGAGFNAKAVPVVGEVWVKIDIEMLKKNESLRFFKDGMSGKVEQIHPKAVLSLITITRHDELRNELKGWNGFESKLKEMCVPIMEFLKGNENGLWIKETKMTDKIGRIYSSQHDNAEPFKVLYIHCCRFRKAWFTVDTGGKRHEICYQNKTMLGLRAPKSVSLYYRRQSMIAELENQEKRRLAQDEENKRRHSKAKEEELAPPIAPPEVAEGEKEDEDDDAKSNVTRSPSFSLYRKKNSFSGEPTRREIPNPPTSLATTREASLRQRMHNLRKANGQSGKNNTEEGKSEYKQRVHEIADIPLDFGQLRAALSIANVVEKNS